jgi:hypothetical protein
MNTFAHGGDHGGHLTACLPQMNGEGKEKTEARKKEK